MGQGTILLADEDEHILRALSNRLRKEGYTVYSCQNGERAWNLIKTRQPRLVIAELELQGINGMLLLERIKHLMPGTPVILTTPHGSIRSAVRAMKLGAADYLAKPVNLREVVNLVEASLEDVAHASEGESRRRPNAERIGAPDIMVGRSPPMQEVFNLVDKVAQSRSNILITGETGTGKELVAQAIHRTGSGAWAPLVTIDCAAIPENLLESELFGYARGAFTGADRSKTGQIEQAHGGTLFLDEIGEMPLSLQKKVLRFLQEKAFVRVGGNRQRRVDVRIVAATNKDLEAEVERGTWREDLFYRLEVIRIDVPPLRQRKEDIPSLAATFLNKHAQRCNPNVREISREAMDCLTAYDWPGNVRELENIMERAAVLADEERITPSCLPERLTGRNGDGDELEEEGRSLPRMERALLEQALQRTRGNKSAAARELGISRKQLRTRMARHGLLENPAE